MRIIAGRFRGQLLKSPAGQASRPTLSRIREALFNILAPRMPDARFLDLYAGTGGIGLEALSRGARQVVFVEKDRRIAAVLAANIKKFDPQASATRLLAGDALAMAEQLAGEKEKFDIIFLDPPYRQEIAGLWAQGGSLQRLLASDGMVIFQHDRKDKMPETWAGLRPARQRHYGETVLAFYENANLQG